MAAAATAQSLMQLACHESLAGVFKDSIPHLLAGAVAFPSLVMAVLLLSWSFRQAAGWQAIYRATLFIALGMLAAFLSMVADVGMPGLQQRAFIFMLLLWLSIVIHRLVRVTAGERLGT
jgi:bacteriorhodopsin